MGCAEDMVFVAGQKPVGECLKCREGVGAGIYVSHAVCFGSHDEHIKSVSPFTKGKTPGAGHVNVIKGAEGCAGRRCFCEPVFLPLFIAIAL